MSPAPTSRGHVISASIREMSPAPTSRGHVISVSIREMSPAPTSRGHVILCGCRWMSARDGRVPSVAGLAPLLCSRLAPRPGTPLGAEFRRVVPRGRARRLPAAHAPTAPRLAERVWRYGLDARARFRRRPRQVQALRRTDALGRSRMHSQCDRALARPARSAWPRASVTSVDARAAARTAPSAVRCSSATGSSRVSLLAANSQTRGVFVAAGAAGSSRISLLAASRRISGTDRCRISGTRTRRRGRSRRAASRSSADSAASAAEMSRFVSSVKTRALSPTFSRTTREPSWQVARVCRAIPSLIYRLRCRRFSEWMDSVSTSSATNGTSRPTCMCAKATASGNFGSNRWLSRGREGFGPKSCRGHENW
jgi:hypothetical protein